MNAIDDDLPRELAAAVAKAFGWQQAVRERDVGTFDWTTNQPLSNRMLDKCCVQQFDNRLEA